MKQETFLNMVKVGAVTPLKRMLSFGDDFGFLGFDSCYYNLKLLPMGFRLAVACAQSIMWALLDFERDANVSIATCIDNVAFAWPREEVYKTVILFLERVEKCNFTVWKAIGPCIINRDAKIQITNRQFFCLIGILVYASDVLAIKTHIFLNLFRKIRQLCTKLSKDIVLWDDLMDINLTWLEREKLDKWVRIVQENKPVGLLLGRKEIHMEDAQVDYYICLDASKDGWGAVFYNNKKEYMGFKQGIWPRGD